MQVPAKEPQQCLRFGPFQVDLVSRELSNNGCKLPLQERPFQILEILLEQPGQIVSREELQRRLWPAGTFVDFEHSINTAVKKLREALDDDPDHPRFVETLSKRGYRFIARLSSMRNDGTRERLFVLPFENRNGAAEEYFADGLTERMIIQLGKVCRHTDVIAPVSVMHYKNRKHAPEILAKMNADYLLAGSVQRTNGRVRINARLIRGGDQCCVWSESYTREGHELFFIQDDISTNIARALARVFSPLDADAASASSTTTTPAVYAKYLMARHFFRLSSVPDFFRTKVYTEQVISEDPGFAPAYGLLAMVYANLAVYGASSMDSASKAAESCARNALNLSPNVEEAECALGWKLLDYDGDFAAADQHFSRAIDINPSYPMPYNLASQAAACQGRFDEAIEKITRALNVDPVCPQANSSAGVVCYLARRFANARQFLEKTIDLHPKLAIAYLSLSWVYLATGDFDKALECCKTSLDCDPSNPITRANLAQILAIDGHRQEALAVLNELLALRKTAYVPPYYIAQVHLSLGDVSQALHWLETAFQERDSWRLMAGVDPRLDPLANHSRFQRLLADAHLPVPAH